jgi:hypothetical protein
VSWPAAAVAITAIVAIAAVLIAMLAGDVTVETEYETSRDQGRS